MSQEQPIVLSSDDESVTPPCGQPRTANSGTVERILTETTEPSADDENAPARAAPRVDPPADRIITRPAQPGGAASAYQGEPVAQFARAGPKRGGNRRDGVRRGAGGTKPTIAKSAKKPAKGKKHKKPRLGKEVAPRSPRSGSQCSEAGASEPDDGSSSDEKGEGDKSKKGFRVQGKQFSLTYPQCEVSRAEFHLAFQKEFAPQDIRTAREQHEDKIHHHIHIYAAWDKKKNITSPRHFDVTVNGKLYHPNIQKTKDVNAWLQYISKEGDYEDSMGEFNILAHPLGKRKAMADDYNYTMQIVRKARDKEIEWPVILKTESGKEYQMDKPDAANKKRSWWIVSPPNSGKSRWINQTFANRKVFVTKTGDYPFETYSGEELIIYDDRDGTKFEEFSNVLNVYMMETHVYGKARYVNVNWPRAAAPAKEGEKAEADDKGAVRSIIVLSNKTIEEQCGAENVERMKKRFTQIIGAKLLSAEDQAAADNEGRNQVPASMAAPAVSDQWNAFSDS